MKFSYLFILFGLVFSLAGQAQEINKKQWTLFSEKTADWCPLCGTWGWNMQKQLAEKFENQNTISWTLHFSGGLVNDAAKEIIDSLGGTYHPIFFEGQTNMNVSSSNVPEKILEAESIVELNQLLDPFAGVGLIASLNENSTLDVNAKVEFLTEVESGNYYLGIYLVEDNLVHLQQGQGQNAIHRYVLRKSLLPNTFGIQLGEGPLEKGKTYTTNVNVPAVTGKTENLKVAGIIWNKTSDGKYRFFNANMVNVQQTSDTENPEVPFKVNASFDQGNLKVSMTNDVVIPQTVLSLFDVQGKLVFTSIVENEMIWEKNYALALPVGTYILNVDAKDFGTTTQKLFKP